MNVEPEPGATPPTQGSLVRLAIAQLMILLGGLGAVAGAAMFIIGVFRATVGANEGGAMQAGGGVAILVVTLPILGVGLLVRPRRGATPPGQPGTDRKA